MSRKDQQYPVAEPAGECARTQAGSGAYDKAVESRRSPRLPAFGQGLIRVPGLRLSLPCRIVDTSAAGARLEISAANAHHLPVRVVVMFVGDRAEVDAVIKWRTQRQCGVQFVSFFRKIESKTRAS